MRSRLVPTTVLFITALLHAASADKSQFCYRLISTSGDTTACDGYLEDIETIMSMGINKEIAKWGVSTVVNYVADNRFPLGRPFSARRDRNLRTVTANHRELLVSDLASCMDGDKPLDTFCLSICGGIDSETGETSSSDTSHLVLEGVSQQLEESLIKHGNTFVSTIENIVPEACYFALHDPNPEVSVVIIM
jgi:hypothetical protein